MPDLSPVQLIIFLIIALVILGPKRLPEVGRSLGRGIREFKDSVTGKDEPEPEETARPAASIDPPAAPVHTPPNDRVGSHRVD
jgi:sec-independent protein translocase protein TatA